jgi:hypothetical protein
MVDFLSLVIESAAAANHSAGTTEIEYPLLASCQFFGSKRKNGLENRDGSALEKGASHQIWVICLEKSGDFLRASAYFVSLAAQLGG